MKYAYSVGGEQESQGSSLLWVNSCLLARHGSLDKVVPFIAQCAWTHMKLLLFDNYLCVYTLQSYHSSLFNTL